MAEFCRCLIPQFPKKSRNWFHASKPHLLALESPTEPEVDLGYKVFAIQVRERNA
jgi:hypothetical protein